MNTPEQLFQAITKRRETLSAKIKAGQPFVAPFTRRYAQAIGKDRLGYTSPASNVVGVDESACSATFILSTSGVDRDGDVVEPSGIKLDNFARNPICMFGHGSQGQTDSRWAVPIGLWETPERKLTIQIGQDAVRGTWYADQGCPDSMFIFGKVARGVLRTASIGFQPLEGEDMSEAFADWWYPGIHFTSVDLLEVSIVPTPANPDAVIVGRGVSISDNLRKCLDTWTKTHAPSKVVVAMPTKKRWKKSAVAKEFPPKKEDDKPAGEDVPSVEENPADKAPASDIQAVLCPKAQYADVAAATQWVTNHGFSADQPVEQPDAWAFVQFNTDECDAATAESQDLGDGVTGVKCNSRVDPNKVQGEVPNNEPGVEGKSVRNGEAIDTKTGKTYQFEEHKCGCGTKAAPASFTANSEEFANMLAKAIVAVRKAEGMNESSGADGGNSVPPDEAQPEEEDNRAFEHKCVEALIAHIESTLPKFHPGTKTEKGYEQIYAIAKKLLAQFASGGSDEEDVPGDNEGDEDDSDDDEEMEKSIDWTLVDTIRQRQKQLEDRFVCITGGVP